MRLLRTAARRARQTAPHVEQAPLGPDEYFTHRLDSDGHHIAYDPRQTRVVMERQFLGIYATLAFATPTER